MAKIKYSALVSDVRNSLNGSTMSKNRYGSYIRNKITPVNPQTTFQQSVREVFGNLSKAWRNLTESQRASWLKGTVNFPFNDIFGDQKHLSGQTLFIKLNANLEKVGQSRVLTAPAPGQMPPWSIGESVGLDFAGLTGPEIEFPTPAGEAADPIPTGFTVVVYMTDPVPAGINFVKNRFRFVGGTKTLSLDGWLRVTPSWGSYASRFGNPVVGEKVYVRYALVNDATGEQGVPSENVFIRTA